MKTLTNKQRGQIRRLGTGDVVAWRRARDHGERVTLASLRSRGILERRAWRGKEGDPNAAYEYRLVNRIRAAVGRRRAAAARELLP